jgi:prolyl 4-hydroxylase
MNLKILAQWVYTVAYDCTVKKLLLCRGAGAALKKVCMLQVVHYGIGGHYEPHYDFSRPGEVSGYDPAIGNRIATVIFYLASVEGGGATVFPLAGARVVPRRGSAALWYNLHRNGTADERTLHAGCPVLTGTKWIGTKWYHEKGQEYIRTCHIDPLL